jgi:hypothetical protein
MTIVAEVYREGHSSFGRYGFEVAPQNGDELLIRGHRYRVSRCVHEEINAPSGEANMQYKVQVEG